MNLTPDSDDDSGVELDNAYVVGVSWSALLMPCSSFVTVDDFFKETVYAHGRLYSAHCRDRHPFPVDEVRTDDHCVDLT